MASIERLMGLSIARKRLLISRVVEERENTKK